MTARRKRRPLSGPALRLLMVADPAIGRLFQEVKRILADDAGATDRFVRDIRKAGFEVTPQVLLHALDVAECEQCAREPATAHVDGHHVCRWCAKVMLAEAEEERGETDASSNDPHVD